MATRTGTMKRVCMYCNKQFGTKPCLPEHDGKSSHGICPDCVAQRERERRDNAAREEQAQESALFPWLDMDLGD